MPFSLGLIQRRAYLSVCTVSTSQVSTPFSQVKINELRIQASDDKTAIRGTTRQTIEYFRVPGRYWRKNHPTTSKQGKKKPLPSPKMKTRTANTFVGVVSFCSRARTHRKKHTHEKLMVFRWGESPVAVWSYS